ncbi:type I pullulanase [Clostridium tarantellae]|uniref:Type I pullulanase n=1 Tax=Clostridium tarantellae TaxID=39493 RepID=A0A6I1MGP9_9CLOT|nr:type I pullulanase [Clostridium tarantellae]MPQ42706.1 type I pullulanase [Clostridium tarantellae]
MKSAFEDKFKFDGELGVIYSNKESLFRLWSPLALKVELKIYENNEDNPINIILMEEKCPGVWSTKVNKDCEGLYYTYVVYFKEKVNLVVDPYAKAVSVNGKRGVVLDLKRTNPEGWNSDKAPILNYATDSILYETHIRDLTMHNDSGVTKEHKGIFKGLIEENTHLPNSNISTVLSHIKELEITHIHFLPLFDFATVDESKKDKDYNWGYDPQNYNAVEGSYCSNPYKPEVRIKEFKELVKILHENGIRVVMDVVYNHTYLSENSNLNLSMPGYFYRQNENHKFTNGSGCGNELASERYMVRKYMVDSVKYWAEEYHIDGFRFDLMAVHDINTLKEIRKELSKIDKNIIIYGEGWVGGTSCFNSEEACYKRNISKFGALQIAAFSDDIRDGIKGAIHNNKSGGFINGEIGLEETIKFGVVGSTYHKQVNYDKVNYSNFPWANEPYQSINYESCHDNYTLWDKIQIFSQSEKYSTMVKKNKLAAAIVLTSQGIPFIHAGEEILRSKCDIKGNFIENSYNLGDFVNAINWNDKRKNFHVFKYYKNLINLRKKNKVFRLGRNKDIQQYISFFSKGNEFLEDNIVAYRIEKPTLEKGWNEVIVIYNGNKEEVKVKLPKNNWTIIVNDEEVNNEGIRNFYNDYIIVKGISCCILAN